MTFFCRESFVSCSVTVGKIWHRQLSCDMLEGDLVLIIGRGISRICGSSADRFSPDRPSSPTTIPPTASPSPKGEPTPHTASG